jgi:CMP-N,N'-diacetyllegionaminic acid synthase
MTYIVALIPARGGSKGIPRKNIKLYRGLPLIAHSIMQAKSIDLIHDVIVSTDDVEIAKIAIEYGASVPFMRPVEYAQDDSLDIDAFRHYLRTTDTKPDIIIHIRPTYPNRALNIISDCINKFIDNYDNYDSLRTVVKCNKSPYKMYNVEENELVPLYKKVEHNGIIINEPYNNCRQYLPEVYLHNGYIDIVKRTVIENGSMSGNNIYPYVMNETEINDIDTINDWYSSENS